MLLSHIEQIANMLLSYIDTGITTLMANGFLLHG